MIVGLTLKVSDDHVITALSQACVDRVREMNTQGVSNALWSAAVLSITDTAITNHLISAVSDRLLLLPLLFLGQHLLLRQFQIQL
jgi:hypothetical protein